MNNIKRFIIFLLVLFIFVPTAYSENKIVYLDLDSLVSNTKAGKIILNRLDKSKKDALFRFEKKEKELKKIENEIKSQKNIISEEEFKKKLMEFRKEISTFNKDKQKVINEFNQKKKAEFEEFFKKITPIIEKYVNEKKIDMVLDKKNIFVASKKKNVTQEIIKIIDIEIK